MTGNSRAQFECDLAPDSHQPRVRFNFDNGWAASLVVLTGMGRNGCDAMLASVAACPSKQWGTGKTEIGPAEAFANEAIEWLHEISRRPAL
jgi:hypothetical protein